MTFSELPIGAHFIFANEKRYFSNQFGWEKVSAATFRSTTCGAAQQPIEIDSRLLSAQVIERDRAVAS